jgi:alanyl-tRNA synthetase
MTERLYYTDPYLTEFDAEILQTTPAPGGRWSVVLDRSAFYPTSGGQPFDTGTLGTAHVLDVVDADDGTVLHVVDGPLAPGPITGKVDWERRFDHMQQHTGQHVLSAAFDSVVGARTVGFHLGADVSTIDLDRDLSPDDIRRAEDDANRTVWRDRPVTIRFVEPEEAARLPLRKEPARQGVLRVIEIAGCDLSACGGTHVASTGSVGIIAVAGWERVRGGSRIEFVCGGRALRSHRRLRDTVSASIARLSVAPIELPSAIERLQAEAKQGRKALEETRSQLASYEAVDLASRAETIGAVAFVFAALEHRDAATLKQMAAAIVARPGHAAVLTNSSPPSSLVVARSADVALDSAVLLKQIVARFGGKGGGRPELAQAGGLQGRPGEILALARQIVDAADVGSAAGDNR